MNGTLRSWIHYLQLRCDPGTQLEHQRNCKKQSNESSANNFLSSERLCSQQIEQLIENYSEPEKAREFLVNAGIIDKDGNLMPPYQPTYKKKMK
jgi:hypothetical protein